ncbi:MAG: hypothetical protein U1C33_04690, partial [Candidatus Cloacimonadaceae bacterium]|nr:hypothetical protein [Candidatus Cloacimonadaceae bacterium]
NLINEPVIGVSYDGTGYGDDGAIWGGEIFIADYAAYQRKYHLSYMPLPGGDSSVVHPIRIAYAYLTSSNLETDFLHGISSLEKRVIDSQLQNKFNLFQTSSMGRLFDCVSAMMGLFSTITFEAQSAMALEQLCAGSTLPVTTCYPFRFHDNEIDIIPLLRSVTDDIFNGESLDLIARKFHNTIIELTISAVTTIKLETEINIVVLSGGVMQNMVLLEGLVNGLRGLGISVFYASRLPANDGAIAMGQVLIANHAIKGIDSIAPHKGSHYRLNHSQE